MLASGKSLHAQKGFRYSRIKPNNASLQFSDKVPDLSPQPGLTQIKPQTHGVTEIKPKPHAVTKINREPMR